MTEPTLLQQAEQFVRDSARALAEQPTCTPFERGILFAVTTLHTHLEQREAAMRGPAQVPGEKVYRMAVERGADGFATLVAKADPAQVPSEPKCEVSDWQKRAEAAEASKAECVRLVGDWYELQKDLQFEDVLLQILKEHSTPALEQRPKPAESPDALDLDELQRLCDAATPGPWTVDDEGDLRAGCAGYDESRGLMQLVRLYAPVALATERPEWESHPPDVAFVAAARDALPKLIARVKELETEAAYWQMSCATALSRNLCPPLEEAFKELVKK